MLSYILKRIFLIALLCPLSFTINATDVVIETDFQTGRGLLRSVGNSCFVYTPQHVVESADGIYVSSQHVRDVDASLLTSYPQDLALLQLPAEQTKMCRQSSWEDGGARVNTLLKASKNALLSFRKKNGALTEFELRIMSKDLHTYFYVQLKDSRKQIIQGMSGSIIYVGTYPIGMLVSVTDGVGKVLRMDSITDISRSVIESFASEVELLAEQSDDLTAFNASGRKGKEIGSLNVSGAVQTFKGQLTKGQSKDYKIIATGNTAYRLTSKKQSQRLYVRAELISPGGDVLKRNSFWLNDRTQVMGFGITEEGEYTLRIKGDDGEVGSYNFNLTQLSADRNNEA